MKKVLLIVGIVLIVAGVLALLFAALNVYMYHNVMDGSAALFARLHQRAIVFFIVGGALTVLGILGVVLRARY